MAISNINAIINDDIHKVWDIVFAVDKYSAWRSDLSKTEIINEKQFIEYTKDGYATTFSITAVEPYNRWEFDMENSNMAGHWTGIFTAKGNETQIDFTENVTPKKWFMKPFVKLYLKKQQTQFVLDLKKALEQQTVKETIGVGVNEKAALSSDKKTALSFTSISILPW